MPNKNFKLCKFIMMGTVFSKCFWGEGVITKELKRYVETLIQCNMSVKYLFLNDPPFRTRFIVAIDNIVNNLPDEYKNINQPNEMN